MDLNAWLKRRKTVAEQQLENEVAKEMMDEIVKDAYCLPFHRCKECDRPIQQTTLTCFAVDGRSSGYYHPECYRKARQKRMILEMTPRMRMERGYDYYDLIELPNVQGHIPVPIAKRLIGQEILAYIPLSERNRNEAFFYCDGCALEQLDRSRDGPFIVRSFFRCPKHRPTTKEENARKEGTLVQLILSGDYRELRYIRATRSGRYQQ